jgi:hypothetical protein
LADSGSALREHTVQSIRMNSGINIDEVNGTLFFAPPTGNKAEGEYLVEYLAGEKSSADETEETPASEQETGLIHGT